MGTDLERKTRNELALLLERCGTLAEGVRFLEGDDLIELLNELDSMRALVADSSTTLRAAISR
ncbi:MAG: hypothetical protein M9890_15325 [Thermomicrobiales bacterium]|nr:hypothetical protein [Thermomicrobiales bacterium]